MDLGLRGRTAVVAASTGGLGEATARALATEGARVGVSGRRGDQARRIAGELPQAVGVEVDLTAVDGPAELAGWLETLAAEVAADGVTVNLLLPGRIATDRVAQLDAAAAGRTGQSVEQVQAASRARIPTGRYGRPEEFGAVAAFLCSEAAGYITGTALRCDGGLVPVL